MEAKSSDESFRTSSEERDIEKDGIETPTLSLDEHHQPLDHATTTKTKLRDTTNLITVEWEEDDPENPFNLSTGKKWFMTVQLGLLALAASLGSAITAPAYQAISQEFGVSSQVAVSSISLYVIGFALGPCLWGPISEMFGRKVSMLPPMIGLSLFSIGCAVSKNAASFFVCRFFSGIFGSSPVSNASAALGDFWTADKRGMAVVLYGMAVVGGPTLGPTIGAAMVVNPSLGWRWTEYILAIWVFVTTVFLYFFLPEMYGPYLLKRKAQRLRKETGDPRYHHPHEDVRLDFHSIVTKHFSRPLRMLTTEPIITAIALYASFVYAILYMTLEFFSIVYHENRGWPLVTSTLPFIGMFVGICSAVIVNLGNQPYYRRAMAANNNRPVPEARMPPMIIGGVSFATGLFLFGWTSDPSVTWVPSIIAAGLIGAGFNIVFQQCINVLVDTYRIYAASATSGNTFLRSVMACGLPFATRPMIDKLGVGPSCSVLGAVAVLAIPVPLLFMRYGKQLRAMSKFAPVDDL